MARPGRRRRSRGLLVCAAAAWLAACAAGEAERDQTIADLMPRGPAGGREAAELAREVARKGELSLADCFRLALHNSQALAVRGEAVVQAGATRREAIAALLPQVGAHAQYIRNKEIFQILINVIPRGRFEFYGHASQKLFDAPAFAAVQVAGEARQIELLRLADERDRLLFEVASTFYEILGLERDREALAATRARASEQSRVVEVELRAGKARPQEAFDVRAVLDEAEMNAVSVDEQIARSRLRLARLVGVSPLPARLTDSYDVRWKPGELPELVEAAGRARVDLAIARHQIAQQEAARRQVKGEYLPTASAEGTYWGRRKDFEEDNVWTVAIYADWNLYDGGGREARLARAQSAVRQAELELESARKDLDRDVEEALVAFRSIDRLLATLDSRVKAADELLERTATALKAGTVTDLHMLLAQEAKADAARDLARTRFARMLALLRIRLVIGDLRRALEDSP